MEDDPREVDWAPKKIRELAERFDAWQAALNELQSAVASMRTQQDFMIGEGHGEPFEVWCRRKINGLGHAFTETDRMIGYMGQRLTSLEMNVARKGDGIAGLSDRVNTFTEAMNRVQELFPRVSALEGYPRRITPGLPRMSEPDDGPSFRDDDNTYAAAGPDGRSPETETIQQIVERRRRVLVESMKDKRITFDPTCSETDHDHTTSSCLGSVNTESGPPAGWVQAEDGCWMSPETWALNQAEVRVRDYMTNHFSTATIEGVVRAIHARPWSDHVNPEDNDSDKPLSGKSRPVTEWFEFPA